MIFVLLKYSQYVLLLEVEKRYYKIIYHSYTIYNVIAQAIILLLLVLYMMRR